MINSYKTSVVKWVGKKCNKIEWETSVNAPEVYSKEGKEITCITVHIVTEVMILAKSISNDLSYTAMPLGEYTIQ